ncbi:MAG: aryl-sulfate sulfotransferase [Ignavibacteriales bacterium]|nr:aryl-sulfate sulfotransferase [Ignavibacteriales bacterium]
MALTNTANASRVRVEFGIDSALNETTPSASVHSNNAILPLLGLVAETKYFTRAVAISSDGQEGVSEIISFVTETPPTDIPRLLLSNVDDPTPGYVMMGFSRFNLIQPFHTYVGIFNIEGKLVWYRRFEGSVIDIQKQPNNNYTVCVAPAPFQAAFYELDNLGNVLRTYKAGANRETDTHELRLIGGSHVLFGLEYRTMDLSEFTGKTNAIVKGFLIEYYRPRRSPFIWKTFDYLSVTDAVVNVSLTGNNVDPWHGNAIEIDTDDNFLVSFRHTEEVIKIHSVTGNIIWRLGGKNNQFQFINDPWNGYSHQHGIRRLENGNIILFDNGNNHQPRESRAVEYHLDEQSKKATLVWEYRSTPPLFSFALGFSQRLRNGNTFITYGSIPRFIEVDASGKKRWEATLDTTGLFVYRAFRIDSLY